MSTNDDLMCQVCFPESAGPLWDPSAGTVYVGTSENFRSYTQNIGFVLGNTGLYLLDGQNLRTPDNNTNFGFNIEPGVTHMYRYAFYVDATGLMNYYIVDLNTGQVSQGTQQCNLASIGSDPKLYISYV